MIIVESMVTFLNKHSRLQRINKKLIVKQSNVLSRKTLMTKVRLKKLILIYYFIN